MPRRLEAPSLQRDVLEALEGARNYNEWIASLIRPHLGDDPVEIGSGIGTFAALWLESGVPRLTVSDVDPVSLDRLRARFREDDRVSVRELDIVDATPSDHSAVVMVNVLEHVADDVGGLRAAARLVREGGTVSVFVPAFPFAMSRFDRAIGHHRRYTRSTLRRTVEDAGLGVEDIRYVNAPGLVAWTLGMRLLRMTPREGSLLHVWDGVVVPVARFVERRRRPPFGQSLFVVARRFG